jgi:hypothetical protein
MQAARQSSRQLMRASRLGRVTAAEVTRFLEKHGG